VKDRPGRIQAATMAIAPVILHLGAIKTGSSALQHDLTWRPRRPIGDGGTGGWCEYVSLDGSGSLLRGGALEAHAATFAAHYSMSPTIPDFLALDPGRLGESIATLKGMCAAGIRPILSCELWLHADEEAVRRFAGLLGLPIHAVAYVRDPMSWMQSLYWQRRRREPRPMREWMAEWLPWSRWADHAAVWRRVPEMVRLDIRLVDGDVPGDFAKLVGCAPPERVERRNSAISGEFARFIERHSLTPSMSVSEARFAWERWTAAAGISDRFEPAPAVFTPEEMETIVAGTIDASRALLEMVDDATRARMTADPRWWSAAAAPRVRGEATGAADPVTEADRLLDVALRALLAADGAWREAALERRRAEARVADLEARLGGPDHASAEAARRGG